MNVYFTKKFKSNYKKRVQPFKSLDKKFEDRYDLFVVNPNSPLLKNHPLKGDKLGLKSFSVTGDIRVIYPTNCILKGYDFF